jgi:hypothetical protein
MNNSPKLAVAISRLAALRRNLPKEISEDTVGDYHSIIGDIQEGTGADLSGFRIKDKDIKPNIIPLGMYVIGAPIPKPIYTDKKFCDSNLFKRQIEALSEYVSELRRSGRQPFAKKAQASRPHVSHVTTIHIENMHGSSIQQNSPGASASIPVAPILAAPPPALKTPRFDLTNLHVTRVPTAPTGYQFRFDLINVGHEAARDLEGKIVMIPLNCWRPPIVIPFSIGNEVFPNTQLSYVSRGISLDPHSSERYIRISFQYRGGGDGASLTQDISYFGEEFPTLCRLTFSRTQKPTLKSGLTQCWTQQCLSSREPEIHRALAVMDKPTSAPAQYSLVIRVCFTIDVRSPDGLFVVESSGQAPHDPS